MPDRTLTRRELNRATLARQMLLNRQALPVTDAVERLVGMQAQIPQPPFVGLWTRLPGFERDDLARLVDERAVVRATMMRATLHLVTTADFLRFRATIQAALDRASADIAKRRNGVFDRDAVLDAARDFIGQEPRTFAEISAMLAERWPDVDLGAMRYTVRTHLRLVQAPDDSPWRWPGNPKFTLAEAWLGQPIPDDDQTPLFIRRYLAAFGPATVADAQTWSGIDGLKAVFEALRPDLVTYRDEKKRELFDLPDAPLPDADTPAPPRFLPEFDNLLLSHKDRTRVLADAHRKGVYLPGLRVAATFLVDGFVAGAWKAETKKGAATLTLTPFVSLDQPTTAALTEEAERLVRFLSPDAKTYTVMTIEA